MSWVAIGRAAAAEGAGSSDASDRLLGGVAFAVTAAVTAANGGYFPPSWTWGALSLLWASLLALLLGRVRRLAAFEAAFAAAVVGLAAWTSISIVWSASPTRSILEAERALLLVAGVAMTLTLARRRPVRPLVAGAAAVPVALSAYALLTRLLPDRVGDGDALGVYRLATPIGYWNGLGIVAVIGLLLCLGIAATAERVRMRALAAACLPVLATTLYFTFSRGAWLALGAGLIVLVALDPRRHRLVAFALAYAPAPAVAVLAASRPAALTQPGAPAAAAATEGHRVALLVLGLTVLQVAVAVAATRVAERVSVPETLRRGFAALLVIATIAVVVTAAVRSGGPLSLVRSAHRSFTAPPPVLGGDLNERLFSLSGNGRSLLWRVAWRQSRAHPLLGDGAGTFEPYWNVHRPLALQVQDAHSLYLESLAELGPLGLGLLAAVLAIPLAAGVRFRRHPRVPAAAAAVAAYGVHAAADWDWELAGVTLVALLAAAACVLAGRETAGEERREIGRATRAAALVAVLALMAFALVGSLGNAAADASASAARAGDWPTSARHARVAIRWAPWSATGWQQLGEAQLATRQLARARDSLRTAIAKDRDNWLLWLDLAAAEHGEPARREIRTALRLNPLGQDVREFAHELGVRFSPQPR